MNEPVLRQGLGGVKLVGRTLCCLAEIGSTNDYGKQLVYSGAESGTVILADRQTAGRGRMDRRFQSPAEKGIYLTALLRPELPPEQLVCVTAMAGMAICDAVEAVCGVRPGLKWPNDPVLNGKKLGGILTELVIEPESGQPWVILGIGLNVKQNEFTPDVEAMATSLEREGFAVTREQVAAALIRALDEMYAALISGDCEPYLAAYRRGCVNLGKAVRLISGGREEPAVAIGIDEQFGLLVRLADGTQTAVRSGEVSVRGLYGYTD
ncbi:MAG: biotin--[Oscillibacter sp.]|nr:biotin--[acetyl-CoA-carboxylase] ligase [Oscillibacter sp.]